MDQTGTEKKTTDAPPVGNRKVVAVEDQFRIRAERTPQLDPVYISSPNNREGDVKPGLKDQAGRARPRHIWPDPDGHRVADNVVAATRKEEAAHAPSNWLPLLEQLFGTD